MSVILAEAMLEENDDFHRRQPTFKRGGEGCKCFHDARSTPMISSRSTNEINKRMDFYKGNAHRIHGSGTEPKPTQANKYMNRIRQSVEI